MCDKDFGQVLLKSNIIYHCMLYAKASVNFAKVLIQSRFSHHLGAIVNIAGYSRRKIETCDKQTVVATLKIHGNGCSLFSENVS